MSSGEPGGRAALRRLAAMIVCAFALGAAAEAGADEGDAVDLNEQARQLFSEAQTAIKKNQWDRARTFFLSAWRIQTHWRIAANLGLTEQMLGRHRDAAEHFAFALRGAPGDLSASDRKRMTEMFDQARARVGAVRLAVRPGDAEVVVDGARMAPWALTEVLYVEPGTHRFEVRREGRVPAERSIDVSAGKETTLDVDLAPKPDGGTQERAAPRESAAPVGAPPPARRRGGVNKGVVIAGATASAAAAGVGAGLLAASFAQASARDAPYPCLSGSVTCVRDVAAAERARADYANASFYALIGAGVLGAGTLAYALLAPQSGRGSRVGISVAPAGPGVVLSGSW